MAITKIYKGSQELENVVRIYKGSELLWEKQSGEPTETVIEFTMPSTESFSFGSILIKEDELPVTITYDDGSYQTFTGSGVKNISSKSFPSGNRTVTVSGEGKYYFNTYLLGMERNSYITNITLSNKVSRLGTANFAGVKNVSSIIIPSSVTQITGGAFGNSSYPSDFEEVIVHPNNQNFIVINGALYTYDKNTLVYFPTKKNVVSLTIEAETKIIEREAFNTNVYIEEVILPNNLETIRASAFENCLNLANINAPTGLVDLDRTALDNTAWYNNASNGIIYFGSFLYRHKGTATGSISVATGTKHILSGAFQSQTGITNVTLPSGLETIGNWAFDGCTNLGNVTLPSSITTIGEGAFYNTNITSITIPTGVTRIENSTFKNSKIGTVTLPSTINFIGTDAFWTKVKRTIICNATTPPTLTKSGSYYYNFGEVYADGGATIKVPSSRVSAYKAAEGWSRYKDVISAI